MRWIVIHLASGDGFLSGTIATTAGLFLYALSLSRLHRILGLVLTIIGTMAASLSATPMPIWLNSLWVSLILVALIVCSIGRLRRRWRVLAGLAAALTGIIAVCLELPHLKWNGSGIVHAARVYVIGDSLSAGIGQEDKTWPAILREKHGVDVIDLSLSGATIGQELNRIRDVQFGDGIVIIEIGGNDIFMRRPTDVFARDLERLAARVVGNGRTVVMFELPLYPLNRAYGRIQRQVARAHGMVLVPRRRLAWVIGGSGATLRDGIHFSSHGHERMAALVWELMGPALQAPR
jgi:acyl-CoA thioesterase I